MYRSLANCNSGGFLSSNYSIRKFGHERLFGPVYQLLQFSQAFPFSKSAEMKKHYKVCGTIDRKANLTNLFDTIIFVIKSQLTVSDNDGYVHAVYCLQFNGNSFVAV
ncbi:hypothetical protein T02_5345 [Trichinella nativa]|uniref:Uncharacterized protein n=1 Tax=Trichinella nativa TaxID=6335 RepID=A0A0V1LDF5_9BILA|nr:hypothetical protein T02_5345 [Trichinella nativa]